jgi:S-adenosylmethionine:tRNA ribosyltransferase-isomerase
LLTADFDYNLPPEYIAQTPLEPRDASRLLVLDRATGRLAHRRFHEIGEYLRPGDLLVFNDSRVIPARLFGRKSATGGRAELLLLARKAPQTWEALAGGAGLRPGTSVEIDNGDGLRAEVVEDLGGARRLVRFSRPITPLLPSVGHTPLPPYIHEPLADPERYQTVYARVEGSAAAPTAGLHFTPELLLRLRGQGVEFAYVTLHVGLDTFAPVTEEQPEAHGIHSEWCEMRPETARQINEARLAGRRVVAVGTTSVRVLESAARASLRQAQAESGEALEACPWRPVVALAAPTDLFILPGHRFRAVDALITNFHLPRSTLLMLVSAFASRKAILRAYGEAVRAGYRFYSFGDAMLIV